MRVDLRKWTRKQRRLYAVLFMLVGIGIATGLVLFALRDNISYFRTPSEVVTGRFPEQASGRAFRLGGLVESGSLKREGSTIIFRVTDLKNEITIRYDGIVPNLFREGQGVIATGRMQNNIFIADQLLAKHDEKYMPPEVARELKAAGHPQQVVP